MTLMGQRRRNRSRSRSELCRNRYEMNVGRSDVNSLRLPCSVGNIRCKGERAVLINQLQIRDFYYIPTSGTSLFSKSDASLL